MSVSLFAPVEPYASGMLDVGDGNAMFWEASGNPAGKAAAIVHGGPGSGSSPGARRHFDPHVYRVVSFDQRGCGRSTPHAADPTTDMSVNTTAHLIADMERLRAHLGIETWLLFGGSWGSTLILAYAQAHPERVSEIVIAGVTTTRRSEIDWLYRGAGEVFPQAWDGFRAGSRGSGDGVVSSARASVSTNDIATAAVSTDPVAADAAGTLEMLAAYARLTSSEDLSVRERATAHWCAWEDAVLSGETSGEARPYSDRPDAAQRAFVRICSHYFSHGAFLDEGALMLNAHHLAGIPGVLIHGRLDVASPLVTASELARAWPGSTLRIVEDDGHLGGDSTRRFILEALAGFSPASCG